MLTRGKLTCSDWVAKQELVGFLHFPVNLLPTLPCILCLTDLLCKSSHATSLSSVLPLSESFFYLFFSFSFPFGQLLLAIGKFCSMAGCCLLVANFALSTLVIANFMGSEQKPGSVSNCASLPTCRVNCAFPDEGERTGGWGRGRGDGSLSPFLVRGVTYKLSETSSPVGSGSCSRANIAA